MKAILVIDMPNNCYDCQYCRFDARKYNFRGCILADTDVQDGTIDICKEIHSCCPLKPMPQKKELKGGWYHPADVWMEGANFGYNACIDEITGETE